MTTALGGCGTAIVTPFAQNGTVDVEALRKLVEWQIEEGIDFLVPCGSTGEAQTLSAEERELVVSTVVESARGRIPVMAGATHNDTRQAVEEARRMSRLGVTWLLSATPYYNKPTPEGLMRHFTAVAEASSVPVCLYNVPGRTAVNMKPDLVLRLASHPNIVGIKESSGDLAQVQHLLLGRPEHFAVLSGEDWMTLAIIAAGGDGLVSVASNEIPKLMSQLVRHMLRGRLEEAREVLFHVLPLLEANFIETNPAPVKAALAAMGRIQNVLRLPLVPLSESRRAPLLAALEAAGVEAAELVSR
ncbi:MAG TPA: 4-hydroxy-tetrahydrodipicolinate synthase [Gemmatimonadales bacterium]|nr:4-hydroxy-tetrahydrodipicolinate synthase [Gemmatimonadales bacterium]